MLCEHFKKDIQFYILCDYNFVQHVHIQWKKNGKKISVILSIRILDYFYFLYLTYFSVISNPLYL